MKQRKLVPLDETIGIFRVVKDLGMIPYGSNGKNRRQAEVKCPHCKNTIVLLIDSAKRNKSCGCKENEGKVNIKHGDHKTRLYRIWVGMRSRVRTPKNEYEQNRYGKLWVDDSWNDYLIFKNWALSNGYSDNLQIDRINNHIGYEPSNCRWVTKAENTKNRLKGRMRKELPKGVTLNHNGKQYKAKIVIDGIEFRLGSFSTVDGARNAYNKAIKDNNLEGIYALSE